MPLEVSVQEEGASLRQDLRTNDSPVMKRRRGIVALSIFSGTVLGGISLFQVGLLKRLPDPPLQPFHANKVNGSLKAYSLLETPDALLGMVSYSVTGCLAGMGGRNRTANARLIPISMGLKLIADAAAAGRLTVQQWTKFRALSIWSLLVSAATFTSLALAIPELHETLSKRN